MANKKFYQMNKAELEQVARALHISVTDDYTKAQIVTALSDGGYTEDDYWRRIGYEEVHHDIPGDIEEVVDEVVDEDVVEEPAAAEDEEDEAPEFSYGRFLGRNLTFSCKYGKFSRTRPVFRMRTADLENLIADYPDKFRRATRTEQQLLI